MEDGEWEFFARKYNFFVCFYMERIILEQRLDCQDFLQIPKRKHSLNKGQEHQEPRKN